MGCVKTKLAAVGVSVPEILLPKKGTDLTKFSVVACDQYSAQQEYWEQVKAFVGDAPSALNLMMPEAWLGTGSDHEEKINPTMKKYMDSGVLESVGSGLVFLHRSTTTGVRRGLVLALDLEQYDFTPGSKALIRATEKTVVERLPTRIEIRKNASFEMPHIMVLINDKKNLLMGWLDKNVASGTPIYDFELMQNSGHSTGWLINDDKTLEAVADILGQLKDESVDGMLYAMGDGNHSMAAAKAHWDNVKKGLSAAEQEKHPARYALVEIVNLFDDALAFEPIHRLVMNADGEALKKDLGLDPMNPPNLQDFQPKLDKWIEEHPGSELEYIHGEQDCIELGKKPGNLAIIWGEFPKDSLFTDVAKHGVLVRKTFSMGSAPDKRFYLECRKII